LVVSEGKEIFHSFWADHESQEPDIFSQFVEAVCQWDDFRILHYGRYETVALKRMKTRLPESLHSKIDAILERSTNVLSVIHPHVYFPVYSSGLKDIGRFLGLSGPMKTPQGCRPSFCETIGRRLTPPISKLNSFNTTKRIAVH